MLQQAASTCQLFDIENAFYRVGHNVIIQALRAFGVPEVMIIAIQHYTLVGFAYEEENGCKGILIATRQAVDKVILYQGSYFSLTQNLSIIF
jgi:hypothetical protein